MILVGDIGGTHTRLALFNHSGGFKILEEEKYASANFSGLEEILRRFLKKKKVRIRNACLAVAGPVLKGKCRITNLFWEIDAKKISKDFSIDSVTLYNDVEAHANGLKHLSSQELYVLQKGKKQQGNQALVAAGTGLGEAGLFWNGQFHLPFATEGGHASFSPKNDLEIEFFRFLNKKFGHVSFERAISGPSIYQIYLFFLESNRIEQSNIIEEEFKNNDPSMVITEYGRLNKNLGCRRTLDFFLSLYGSEAGNTALKFLAFGGIYIGGGIIPRLVEILKESNFLISFIDKGRFKKFLQSIPIYIVLNEKTALLGLASFARDRELSSN